VTSSNQEIGSLLHVCVVELPGEFIQQATNTAIARTVLLSLPLLKLRSSKEGQRSHQPNNRRPVPAVIQQASSSLYVVRTNFQKSGAWTQSIKGAPLHQRTYAFRLPLYLSSDYLRQHTTKHLAAFCLQFRFYHKHFK
jgi:hypothetical protein